MGHSVLPAESRRHIFTEGQYIETPQLAMPGGSISAINVAKMMVRFGVDGRGPQSEPASAEELAAAYARLEAVHRATNAAGFMIGVRFVNADSKGAVRACYTYAPGRAGLIVADRPPRTSGRLFSLQWVLGGEGPQEPRIPPHISSKELPYVEGCARAYGELWSSVMGTDPDSALEVVRTTFVPFQAPLPRAG